MALINLSGSYTSLRRCLTCAIQNLSTVLATPGGRLALCGSENQEEHWAAVASLTLVSGSLKCLLIHFTLSISWHPAQSWVQWALGPGPGHGRTADHYCHSGACPRPRKLWHCSKSRRNAQQALSPITPTSTQGMLQEQVWAAKHTLLH